MGLFEEYCRDPTVTYRVPASPPGDPLEHPPDGSEGFGRLTDFAAWLWSSKPGLSGDTIAQYISTVRQSVAVVVNWEFRLTPILRKFVFRLRQQPRQRHHRLPATVELVKRVVDDASIPLGTRVAVLVAYNCLLRVGEYCSERAHSFRVGATLLGRHVVWDRGAGAYRLHIPHSKSDRYNVGDDMYIHANTADPYCPAAALRLYINSEPLAAVGDEPFFVKRLRNGNPSYVTPSDIAAALKKHAVVCGIPVDRVSSHSLRIGACFEMATAGVDWETIAVRGRWSQASLTGMAQRYAQMSKQRLVRTAAALSLSKPVALWAVPLRCE